jgi:hypothetical protein
MLLDEQERRAAEPVQLMKDAQRPTLPSFETLPGPASLDDLQIRPAIPAPLPTE